MLDGKDIHKCRQFLLATGVGQECITDGNSRTVIGTTTSAPLFAVFKMVIIANPATGKSVTTLSVDICGSVGIGFNRTGQC